MPETICTINALVHFKYSLILDYSTMIDAQAIIYGVLKSHTKNINCCNKCKSRSTIYAGIFAFFLYIDRLRQNTQMKC